MCSRCATRASGSVRAANGENLRAPRRVLFRPVGKLQPDRQGKKYAYTRSNGRSTWPCAFGRRRSVTGDLLAAGFAEEQLPGHLPFDYRQHFVVSFTLRARCCTFSICAAKARLTQLEIFAKLCDLILPHLETGAAGICRLVREKSRLHKARLAP